MVEAEIENDNTDNIRDKVFYENNVLSREFYERDTAIVAKELLGKILIVGELDNFCGGIIVEDEAYYGTNDPASHASNGITPRSRIMFKNPGIAYVYFCYGNYYLLNAVTEKFGTPGAVLIRAIEPLFGIQNMMERRKNEKIIELTNGPGKLTMAFNIRKEHNGKNLTSIKEGIFMLDTDKFYNDIKLSFSSLAYKLSSFKLINESQIAISPRIGIKKGRKSLLRFYLKNNKFVSRK